MSAPRALLITDVVDSTQLSLRLGDAQMASLWAAHDRAARDLLPLWRGREIDKTDGMLLLFDTAADAVGYALAYQRALESLQVPLKARAGLHVGPVTLRENSAADVALGAKPIEVEGVAKATTARVMSIASGGQILLSADARRALNDDASDGAFRLQSHGHWRLKGLDEPLELYEVAAGDRPCAPPADGEKAYRVVREGEVWSPARDIRHSLPAEGDAFVGRADALAELSMHIRSGARLVSVLGIGGSGKTRLATRYGRSWLGEFPGGVWFCDLAGARGVDGIVSAVALGLDVPLGADDPVVRIGNAIAGRGACLVILDNFEQVARHAATTLGHWLARAGLARFVVTTREVLGLAGETVLALAPMPANEGATLFAQRARAVRPDFHPDADDAAAVLRLVDLLDGLPLAIELAAARVRVMAPRMLLARMSERFKLLASKAGRLDRQSTLRAAFDWSWDLLTPPEKAALAQLSVFEGGFTLEAAEGVLDLSGFDDVPWAVDVVQSLVDKSLVRARGDERFDLLVSVQVYAAERLAAEGDPAGGGPLAFAAAQARHLAWFAALGPISAVTARCAELDNLVAACRRAVAQGASEAAVGALEGAWAALSLRGPFHAGVALAEAVCAMPALGEAALAHAQSVLVIALVTCGRSEPARALCDRALAHARAAGDRRCEATLMCRLGSLHQSSGRMHEARDQYLAASRMARELGEARLESLAYSGLGNIDVVEGHMDAALSHYERALALAVETNDRHMQGNLLGNLGKLHMEVGRTEEALQRCEQSLATARDTGNRRLESRQLCNLGMLYIVLGRPIDSEARSKAALAAARELGDAQIEAIVRCNLGIVIERLGRPDEAMVAFESAVDLARTLADPMAEGQFLSYLGLLHARQGRHDEARTRLASAEALLRAASDAFGLGVLMAHRAEAHHLAGDVATARATLAAAARIAAEVGAGPASEIGLALVRVRALVEPGSP